MLEFSLVNFSPSIKHSFLFVVAAGFVVDRKLTDYFPFLGTHDGPAVPYIGHVEHVPVEESDDGTGPGSVQPATPGVFDEGLLAFVETLLEGNLHVLRESEYGNSYDFSLET